MSIDQPEAGDTPPPTGPPPTLASVPDYDLPDLVHADAPQQLKAMSDPLRSQILDLVLDRAATVKELAEAVGRPSSSVAHHVGVLVDAGLLTVVRTRRVRAIDERFYGRTGRTIVIGDSATPADVRRKGMLHTAVSELPTDTDVLATLRHVRIPADRAEEFFARVADLADEFTRLPRSGDTVFGFVAAVYPTDHPVLPEPKDRGSQ